MTKAALVEAIRARMDEVESPTPPVEMAVAPLLPEEVPMTSSQYLKKAPPVQPSTAAEPQPLPEDNSDPAPAGQEVVPETTHADEEPAEGEIYIDRGFPLPERYIGARMRVMVRDPGTLYVYWEIPENIDTEAWEVSAMDRADSPLDSFRVRKDANCGYLRVRPEQVGMVLLRAVQNNAVTAPVGIVEYGTPHPQVTLHEPAPLVELTDQIFEERRAQLDLIAARVRAMFEAGPATNPVGQPSTGPFERTIQPFVTAQPLAPPEEEEIPLPPSIPSSSTTWNPGA